jgi:hypothetical protein
MLLDARVKILRAYLEIYPVVAIAVEDVRFHHAAKRGGKLFSVIEHGKNAFKAILRDAVVEVVEFRGFETQALRKQYGYKKTRKKSADKFTAHCSDALALAVAIGPNQWVLPGKMLVVDDTYRPKRRQLHASQPKNGKRDKKSVGGHACGIRKGLLVGTQTGCGRLCGWLEKERKYRYRTMRGTRSVAKQLQWISTQFIVRDATLAAA